MVINPGPYVWNLDSNMQQKGPTTMDNYHVTDSNLNLKEAASEVDGTQEKWEEQEGWSSLRNMSTKIYQ